MQRQFELVGTTGT